MQHLTLCGHFKPNREYTLRLCGAINSLCHLKALDILMKNLFLAEDYTQISIESSIRVLHQLEQFSIVDHYMGELSYLLLTQQLSPKLKRLRLEQCQVEFNLQKLMATNRMHFTTCSLTHLYLNESDFQEPEKWPTLIREHLPSLQHLCIRSTTKRRHCK